MADNARTPARRWLGTLIALLLVCLVVVAVANRQEIQDRFKALGFTPSARVTEVMQNLQLSQEGERVFLASRPTIDGSQRFNAQCANVDRSDQGHVLGCFTNSQIHLFEVRDERINGIVEVTAAHELLHAGFARLGEGERVALGKQLRTEYDRLAVTNPELKERMALYEQLSDGAFANELHSVLGTEVRELPDWLKAHYARWFADRDALIDAFDAYHSVFLDLKNQATALESEMRTLRGDVEARKVDYDRAVEQFNIDAEDFSSRNKRFEFSSAPEEFERIRAELAARRIALQQTMDGLEGDIDRYNGLRDQLSVLSETSSELDEHLNSDLAPVTTRPAE